MFRVQDVCKLTDCLRLQGIAVLVWGEMASLGAYGGRIIPSRLFFIVSDNCFHQVQHIFLHELEMEQYTEFRLSEQTSLPLSVPYLRYKLEPVLKTPAYVQIFKASEVGLNYASWGRCCVGHYRGGMFLVPSPSDFLEICAFLYRKFLNSGYDNAQIDSAIEYLQLFLYECFTCELFQPTLSLKVREDLAPFAWWLCTGLISSHVNTLFVRASKINKSIRKPLEYWIIM